MAALSPSHVNVTLGLGSDATLDDSAAEGAGRTGLPAIALDRRPHVSSTAPSPSPNAAAAPTPSGVGKGGRPPKGSFGAHFRFSPVANPDAVMMGLSGGRGRRAVPKALPEEPPASPLLRLMPGVRTDKLAKPRDGLAAQRESEREQQLIAYLSSYEKEQQAFSSTYIWCDVLMQKAISETSGQPRPHPLRTAVSCMLLNRIAGLFTRYEKFLYGLADQVYASVYLDWPDNPPGPSQPAAYSIGAFMERTTYYAKMRDTERAETELKIGVIRDRVMNVLPRVLRRAAATLDVLVKRSCFHLWRQFVVDQRKQTTIEKQLQEQEERQRAATLGHCFRAWRQVIRHDKEVRVLNEELQAERGEVKWMRRKIETLDAKMLQLEKDNEQLRHNASAMATTMQALSGTLTKYQASLTEPASDDSPPPGVLNPEVAAQLQQLCERGVLAETSTTASRLSQRPSTDLQPQPGLDDALEAVQLQVTAALQKDRLQAADIDIALSGGPARRVVSTSPKRQRTGSPKGTPATGQPRSRIASPLVPAEALQEEEPEDDSIERYPSAQHLLVWLNMHLADYPRECPKYIVNLTSDFRDGVKLACLLHAVGRGADEVQGLVERVKAVRGDRLLDRATLVIEAAQQLLGEDLMETMKPSDIVKGRGTQMAKFFLRLYDFSGGEDADIMQCHEKVRNILNVLRKSNLNFEFVFSELGAKLPLHANPTLRHNERFARKSQKRRAMRDISDLAPLAPPPDPAATAAAADSEPVSGDAHEASAAPDEPGPLPAAVPTLVVSGAESGRPAGKGPGATVSPLAAAGRPVTQFADVLPKRSSTVAP
eukprot:EG_transcript_2495